MTQLSLNIYAKNKLPLNQLSFLLIEYEHGIQKNELLLKNKDN